MHSGIAAVGRELSKLRWSLLLIIGIIVSLATGNFTTVLLVVGVILMVMIHEFGHFLTAKFFDMKVTEYFLGFGPRLWSFMRGETEYGVKGIPAGGYVRIIGMNNLEEVDPADEPRTYRQKPIYQRIIVVCAGSFMHFVMAFALAMSVLMFVGIENASTKVDSVTDTQASPAAVAGIEKGDQILAINNVPVNSWDEITAQLGKAQIGVTTPVEVKRKGQDLTFNVVPADRRSAKLSDGTPVDATPSPQATAFVGISPGVYYKTVSPWSAAPKVGKEMWSDSKSVVSVIGHRFSPSGFKTSYQDVTGTLPANKVQTANDNRVLSPVGLVRYAHDAARSGWASSLTLLYAINLFVGIFNMTPLLPFDGGHVAIALYEKVRSIGRKRYYMADFNKMLPVSYAVLLVLVVVSASALYLDIVSPAPNPFQ